MTTKKIPILISGGVGTGKSTLGKHLAKHYHRKFTSASDTHRKVIARLEKLDTGKMSDRTFWETKAGEKGMQARQRNLHIDRTVDETLLAALKKNPNNVSDARLMPWLYKGKAIRIYVKISEKESARRVRERDNMPISKVLPKIRKRFKADQKLFKKLYGIDYGKDFSPFDLVINTEGYEAKDTFRVVKAFVDLKLRAVQKTRH